MTSYKPLIKTALGWNLVEELVYQPLLLTHEVMLALVMGASAYGTVSIAISLAYGLSVIFNLGLDSVLGTNFAQATTSRQAFRGLILKPLVLQVMLIIGSAGLCLLLPLPYITFPVVLVAGIQSIRKTIKTILQLGFYTAATACAEIGIIVMYMLIVWTYLYRLKLFSPSALLYALGGCIFATLLVLLVYLHRLYYSLPHMANTVPSSTASTLTMRAISSLNQCTGQFFSSNMLVPIVGAATDTATAGALYLVSSFLYIVTGLIRKTLSNTSTSLFAHTKHRETSENKQILLAYFSNRLIIGCALVIAVFTVLTPFTTYYFFTQSNIRVSIIYFYLLVRSLEGLIAVHAPFFIIEEKIKQWGWYSLTNLILIGGTFFYASSTNIALGLMLMGRTVAFGILLWSVLCKPTYNPLFTTSLSFLMSILVLTCFITIRFLSF